VARRTTQRPQRRRRRRRRRERRPSYRRRCSRACTATRRRSRAAHCRAACCTVANLASSPAATFTRATRARTSLVLAGCMCRSSCSAKACQALLLLARTTMLPCQLRAGAQLVQLKRQRLAGVALTCHRSASGHLRACRPTLRIFETWQTLMARLRRERGRRQSTELQQIVLEGLRSWSTATAQPSCIKSMAMQLKAASMPLHQMASSCLPCVQLHGAVLPAATQQHLP
jgi:hypothetical protein